MLSRRQRRIRRHVLIYTALTPFLLVALFPVVWMLITAFKDEADLYRLDVVPFWFNLPPTLKNFELLFFHSSCSCRWRARSAPWVSSTRGGRWR